MSLPRLIKERGNICTQVTKLHDKVMVNINTMTEKEKNVALARLEQFDGDIRNLDRNIYHEKFDDDEDQNFD